MAIRLLIAVAIIAAVLVPASAVQSPPLDPITARWTGDFDGMIARRRIRILTPYSRTHYFFDHGAPQGIVYEAGLRFERALNEKLKTSSSTRVHIVFVPVPGADLLDALIEGRGDIIATNLAVTPERSTIVDFTSAGRTGVRRIVVTGDHVAPMASAADLSSVDVTVREDSLEVVELQRLNVRLREHAEPLIRITTVPASMEDEELLEMVDRGLIRATVLDDFVASFWSRTFRGVRLHTRAVIGDKFRIGWAVRRGSRRLVEELDAFLRTDGPGTRLGQSSFIRYQRDALRLHEATRGAELERFTALIDLFRAYSHRYGLDYRLMMAQAYQESRLDQRARSAAGAVGIMQVMPDTADELSVGDVRQTENNIHAGVKYVRQIIDRHFADRSLDELNRSLFAFAAYNCGPARVRQLRREARRRGLNPDRWFGHVEVVAGERVGGETVRYVSNVYKYYVGYSLALAHNSSTR